MWSRYLATFTVTIFNDYVTLLSEYSWSRFNGFLFIFSLVDFNSRVSTSISNFFYVGPSRMYERSLGEWIRKMITWTFGAQYIRKQSRTFQKVILTVNCRWLPLIIVKVHYHVYFTITTSGYLKYPDTRVLFMVYKNWRVLLFSYESHHSNSHVPSFQPNKNQRNRWAWNSIICPWILLSEPDQFYTEPPLCYTLFNKNGIIILVSRAIEFIEFVNIHKKTLRWIENILLFFWSRLIAIDGFEQFSLRTDKYGKSILFRFHFLYNAVIFNSSHCIIIYI